MLGYPGSGKSYFARQLALTSGAIRLSQDSLRKELFENPREHISPNDDNRLLDLMNERVADYLKAGKSIIYDANVELHENRTRLYEIALSFAADIFLIWVKTPLTISIERNGPAEEDKKFIQAYKQMVADYEKRFEPPRANEPTIVINGEDAIEAQITAINRQLSN